jgi:hypothetical protein
MQIALFQEKQFPSGQSIPRRDLMTKATYFAGEKRLKLMAVSWPVQVRLGRAIRHWKAPIAGIYELCMKIHGFAKTSNQHIRQNDYVKASNSNN